MKEAASERPRRFQAPGCYYYSPARFLAGARLIRPSAGEPVKENRDSAVPIFWAPGLRLDLCGDRFCPARRGFGADISAGDFGAFHQVIDISAKFSDRGTAVG